MRRQRGTEKILAMLLLLCMLVTAGCGTQTPAAEEPQTTAQVQEEAETAADEEAEAANAETADDAQATTDETDAAADETDAAQEEAAEPDLSWETEIPEETDWNAAPVLVTADNVDPQYATPVIDSIEEKNEEIHYVEYKGHWEESPNARFTFCFPDKEYFDGRFIQMVYPGTSDGASSVMVQMDAMLGGYTVRCNTPATGGYRQDAAAAKYSRVVAEEFYDYHDHIYGYIFGGSGGGYVTMGAAEWTKDVYDGAMPAVIGTGASIPYAFSVRAFACFILADKVPQIAEAVSPGGSGDPFEGLTDLEADVLHEVLRMGVPLSGFEDGERFFEVSKETYDEENAGHGLPRTSLLELAPYALIMDSNYVEDFWTKDGYLGTEDSELGDLFRESRIEDDFTISKINRSADGSVIETLEIENAPVNDRGLDLYFSLTGADGEPLKDADGNELGQVDGTLQDDGIFVPREGQDGLLSNITDDTKFHISNSQSLALLVVHRYHIPAENEIKNYFQYEQFLNEDGSYPDN